MIGLLRDLLQQLRISPPRADEHTSFDLALRMFHEIGRAMSSSMESVDRTLDLICEGATAVLGVQRSLLFSLDAGLSRLTVRAGRGLIDLEALKGQHIPDHAGAFGRAIETGHAVSCLVSDEPDSDLRALYGRLELTRFLAAPLRVGDTTLGVLIADTKVDDTPFDEREARLIEVLANLAAITEENASLVARLRSKADRMDAVLQVSRAVSSTLDLADLFSLIQAKALELTGARTSAILMVDKTDGCLVIRASKGVPAEMVQSLRLKPGAGIAGWAMLSGQPVVVHDVSKDPRYIVANPRVQSELAVPMLLRDQVIGVINVDSFEVGAFSDLDRQLLEAFAASAAVAIHNAETFGRLREGRPSPPSGDLA